MCFWAILFSPCDVAKNDTLIIIFKKQLCDHSDFYVEELVQFFVKTGSVNPYQLHGGKCEAEKEN